MEALEQTKFFKKTHKDFDIISTTTKMKNIRIIFNFTN